MKTFRRILFVLLQLVVLAATVVAFFGVVPYGTWALKPQSVIWGVCLTLLLGRFFCRALCPLGILQTFVHALVHPKSHVRRVCTRLPETRGQRLVRWAVLVVTVGLAVAGFSGLLMAVTPIALFGRAVSVLRAAIDARSFAPAFADPETCLFSTAALGGLLVVLVLAACGKGRFWCNWICPYGTVYALAARLSLRKDRFGRGCAACRRCLDAEKAEPVREKSEGVETTRRSILRGVATLAVTEKLTDGGLARVSLPGRPTRTVPVLPPGAGIRRLFALRCVGCQLCVNSCPGDCLRPSLELATFGQPAMDFRRGFCIPTCRKCAEACPVGAIDLRDVDRRFVRVGKAVLDVASCLRTAESKVACTACVRKCPVQAIKLVKDLPVVDADACLGCGACEHVCPVRPNPAIRVEGYEEQRIFHPRTAVAASGKGR